jgi:hypothetical protein
MVRLLTAFAVLLGATYAVVTVPEGLADGVYSISMETNDVTFLKPITTRSRIERRQTLPSPEVTCGKAKFLNINDYNTAKENFEDFCDLNTRIEPSSAVLYVTGTAMAYLCNYGDGNWCYRREYDAAVNLVVNQCGTGSTGEVYVDK